MMFLNQLRAKWDARQEKKEVKLVGKLAAKLVAAKLATKLAPKLFSKIKEDKLDLIDQMLCQLSGSQKLALLKLTFIDCRMVFTPLCFAGFRGDVELTDVLLKGLTPDQQLDLLSDKACLLNEKEGSGSMPLFLAMGSTYDSHLLAKTLLANLEPTAKQLILKQVMSYGGITALMKAAEMGRDKAIEIMLEGLDADQKQELFHQTDKSDKTAIMFAYEQKHNAVIRLLIRHGAQRPAMRSENELYDINGKQSTHVASAESSLARSAIGLAARYLAITQEDRAILQAWAKGNITQEQDSQNHVKALELIERADIQEVLKKLTDEHETEIDQWVDGCAGVTDQKALLKKSVERIGMIKNNEFNTIRSGLTPLQALVLVWKGISDTSMFKGATNTKKEFEEEFEEELEEELKKELGSRCQVLRQNLCEIQTDYGKDADGNDIAACAGGTFNKLISTLAGGLHADVSMIFVSEATVKAKTMALVSGLFKKAADVQEELKALKNDKDFELMYTLPEPVRFSLQAKISPQLHEEFDEFVVGGLLEAKKIDSASAEALCLLSANAIQSIQKALIMGL